MRVASWHRGVPPCRRTFGLFEGWMDIWKNGNGSGEVPMKAAAQAGEKGRRSVVSGVSLVLSVLSRHYFVYSPSNTDRHASIGYDGT